MEKRLIVETVFLPPLYAVTMDIPWIWQKTLFKILDTENLSETLGGYLELIGKNSELLM